MSTPEEEFPESRSNHPKYVLRYTCTEDGGDTYDMFAEGVADRRTRAVLFGDEPELELRGRIRCQESFIDLLRDK